jgi:hypothetical protein
MYIVCKDADKFNISLMYDLLLYFTFYTHLKGQLQTRIQGTSKNKSIVCFIIKAVLSPLVFGYLNKASTKEVIVSEIVNRYKKYKDNKVFDSVISEATKTYGSDIDISEDSIRKTINSVCDIALNNIESFELKKVAGKYSVNKVPITSIFEVNNLETVRKILIIESLLATNNKIDKTILKDQKGIDTLLDIPKSILDIFNLGEKKANIENLLRFVQENMKDSHYLPLALKELQEIKISYRDLKNKNIEFVNFDEQALKAIVIWDIEEDEKIQDSYAYFKNKVENCTIDRNMALSMLMNIKDKTSSDYSNSLTISKIN